MKTKSTWESGELKTIRNHLELVHTSRGAREHRALGAPAADTQPLLDLPSLGVQRVRPEPVALGVAITESVIARAWAGGQAIEHSFNWAPRRSQRSQSRTAG